MAVGPSLRDALDLAFGMDKPTGKFVKDWFCFFARDRPERFRCCKEK
jgi:hypothetical protein